MGRRRNGPPRGGAPDEEQALRVLQGERGLRRLQGLQPAAAVPAAAHRGKVRARRVTGLCPQHQREAASAIKRARDGATSLRGGEEEECRRSAEPGRREDREARRHRRREPRLDVDATSSSREASPRWRTRASWRRPGRSMEESEERDRRLAGKGGGDLRHPQQERDHDRSPNGRGRAPVRFCHGSQHRRRRRESPR